MIESTIITFQENTWISEVATRTSCTNGRKMVMPLLKNFSLRQTHEVSIVLFHTSNTSS